MDSHAPQDISNYIGTQSVPSSLQLVRTQDLKCKKILGEGGFGIVYLAHHRNWDDVAVKILRSISGESTKLFRREVLRMLKTASQQVVRIYGLVEPSPKVDCCIVMEYMEFGSLSSFRQRLKTFPDSVKIHMIYEIALGMNFLHTLDEPIIHRDLKLDNVFVSKRLEAKVGDFGLATYCNASNFRVFAGTFTHIPPEQLEDINKPVTTKCDVYSFGVTLWELATGQQVYENCIGNSKQIMLGVLGGQRPDKNKIPENEPLIITTLMEETWQQDPAQRPDFKDIKDKIKKEFDLKYKQHWEDHRSAVLKQLEHSDTSVHKDQSHEETAKFPWDNNTVLDSPNTTNTGTPAPLQSVDSRPGTEVKGYPVAASDDGAPANILGHSLLMNQVTTQKPSQEDNLGRSLSKMTLTSSPVQATPSGAFPIQASDAQLHESAIALHVPSSNQASHVPSSNQASHVPSSNQASHVPSSNQASHVPSSNQASHVPSSNQASHVPSSNQASHVPSSDQASHVPSSDQASYVPSSNRASHPPSSNQAFEPRSSSEPNTEDNLGRSLSKMTLTSSPVQATPSGAFPIQASDAQLHESAIALHVPSSNQASHVPSSNQASHVPSSNQASHVPSSNQASHVPSSNQASHVPSSNQASHVPSSNQASHVPSSDQASYVPSSNRASHPPSSNQAFGPRSSSEPNTAPQGNININVTGDGNVTSVWGNSVVHFGRRKHKKKSKKKRTPPPSSSSSPSSSSDDDDTDAATVRTTDRTTHSITTSREPVTEKIISKIDKHIGKKWKNLGRMLKLTDAEIDNVEGDNILYGRHEMAHQVMLTWQRSRRRSEATKAKLAKALVDAGLTNVAQML